MDKGIRAGVNFKFNEMLPQLAAIGGKAFRRAILDWTVENYDVTMGSASTHYNFSKHAADAATIAGLGRAPEKNNGGRKKKDAAVDAVTPAALLNNMLAAVVKPEAAATEAVEQTVFEVRKKKDNSVVATGLSFEDAKLLVETAANTKFKPRLYWI
jgi:hypothetical protein